MIGLIWNRDERRLRAIWRLAVQALLVVFFSVAIFFVLFFFIDLEEMGDVENPPVIVASNLVLIAAVLIAAFVLDRRAVSDFGLRTDRNGAIDVLAGLILATLCLLIMFLFMLATGWITVQTAEINYGQIAAWFVAFAFVGLGEELLARGYHLRNMAEGLNGRWLSPRSALIGAAVLSSVAFGLLHVPNPNMTAMAAVNLCIAGIVLALPVLLTGRMGLAIGFHIAWNFVLGNVLGFPVSGLRMEHTVLQTESIGPEWMTGGAFGPEGGVIGLATDAVAVVLIVLYVRASEGRVKFAVEWTVFTPPSWRRIAEPPPLPDDPFAHSETFPRQD